MRCRSGSLPHLHTARSNSWDSWLPATYPLHSAGRGWPVSGRSPNLAVRLSSFLLSFHPPVAGVLPAISQCIITSTVPVHASLLLSSATHELYCQRTP